MKNFQNIFQNYNGKTTDNQEEQLIQVDENDNIIGPISRKICHNETSKPWHRTVHAYLFNEEGELYLSQRSLSKDTSPGEWGVSAGGHIGFGDDYKDTIVTEISEELSVTAKNLEMIDKLKVDSGSEKEFIGIFAGIVSDEPKPNTEEVEQVKFFPLDEIIKLFQNGEFDLSSGSRDTFKHIIKTNSLIDYYNEYLK